MEETPKPDAEHYWFRIGKILDFDERQKFDDFLDVKDDELTSQGLTRSERKTFERNLTRLYQAIHEDEVIAYYTETDQDYDRVLDIFVRANEGGTKLSKSDLLLSMVTSNWDGVNAREEIFNFVDRVNTQLTRRNDFDKDFIMKSCLVLTDLPVAYKVQNFNNANLTTIRRDWPAIKKAIERGVDLVNSFGIDRDNLTSANALIPIIYYLFKNPGVSLRGSPPFEARNAEHLRRWLIMALLNGVFGGTSDNMLRDIRASLQAMPGAGADFPIEDVNITIRKAGRSAECWLAPMASNRLSWRYPFCTMTRLGERCSSIRTIFSPAGSLSRRNWPLPEGWTGSARRTSWATSACFWLPKTLENRICPSMNGSKRGNPDS